MKAKSFLHIVLIFTLAFIFGAFIKQYLKPQEIWHHSESEAVSSLLQIYNAEWKWHNMDIDDNSIQDFWTRDIAGLFFYTQPRDGKKVKLIPREIAVADMQPFMPFYLGESIESLPYKGYSFKMALFDEHGFFQAKKDPSTGLNYRDDKFCAIAFPNFNKNLRTFMIDSSKKIIYCRVNDITEADKWPNESDMKKWKELDLRK